MNITKLIVIIRNAIKINKQKITVTSSKKIKPFLEILYKEKYIAGYAPVDFRSLAIYFNSTYKKNKILSFKHVSTSSRPVYFSYQDLYKFKISLHTIILSTSKGVISHKSALTHMCGGEVICILL
ncbi:MAG TPA: 30S ribosomal protein S8 [Flavobacterium sp.]